MRVIPIEELEPGMILAKPILRERDGAILLQDRIELKPSYIERIKSLNYTSVCILDPETPEEIETLTPIREETRFKATALLRTTFSQFKENDRMDTAKLTALVHEIIDQILSDPRTVYNLSQIRAFDNYTFTHSVDVAVLSVLIGTTIALNRNDLEILGIGAMLHDIGKVFTDLRILNKPSQLNPEEYELIKLHTRMGYESLRTRTNISFLVPHMTLQHHEREDGSGYPRGLVGTRIHRFAKIIAVADVFDAMTSYRLYQEPVPSQIAIQEICEKSGTK
ncbi:MAG TPA: HD domain-containing phosphohydrolase, partial [Bacillota bacterium]